MFVHWGMSETGIPLDRINWGAYDLVVIDGKAPSMRPLLPENIIANMAYSMCNANVKTVMCQGDLVVENRNSLTMDKDALLDQSEDAFRTLCLR